MVTNSRNIQVGKTCTRHKKKGETYTTERYNSLSYVVILLNSSNNNFGFYDLSQEVHQAEVYV